MKCNFVMRGKMKNFSRQNLKLFLFTVGFFTLGIFYYWLFREQTVVSEYLGISYYTKDIEFFRIDWFPSFVHQFSFVIFTWLALERSCLWFSLFFWFITNSLFELGQAIPGEYLNYFPKVVADYFKHGTYTHEDMLAIVVATLVAYVVMMKHEKKGAK